MNGPMLDFPLEVICKVLLADVAPSANSVIREVLQERVATASVQNKGLMRKLHNVKGGPCLPFELSEDERLVSRAILAGRRRRLFESTIIFSSLALVDAGAAVVHNDGQVEYLDSAPVVLRADDSWLYPAAKGLYIAFLRDLQVESPTVTLTVQRSIEFRIPVGERVFPALRGQSGFSAMLWDQFFETTSGRRLTSCEWSLDSTLKQVVLKLKSPEDALRLTATAELNGWLWISGGGLSACIHLVPMLSMKQSLLFVFGSSILDRLLLHDHQNQAVQIPIALLPVVWPVICHHASVYNDQLMRHAVQTGLIHA